MTPISVVLHKILTEPKKHLPFQLAIIYIRLYRWWVKQKAAGVYLFPFIIPQNIMIAQVFHLTKNVLIFNGLQYGDEQIVVVIITDNEGYGE